MNTTDVEDLTGRYILAVVTSPMGGDVKKGEYGKVTGYDNPYYRIDFPSQFNYCILLACIYDTTRVKIMPVGFDINNPGSLEIDDYPIY